MVYLDIPTMTKKMKVPSVITLPFHFEQPIPHSEERTFRPQDVEWPDALERWAFLHGYAPAIALKGKDYDPARQSSWPSLRWETLRAKALAGLTKAYNPSQTRAPIGSPGGGRWIAAGGSLAVSATVSSTPSITPQEAFDFYTGSASGLINIPLRKGQPVGTFHVRGNEVSGTDVLAVLDDTISRSTVEDDVILYRGQKPTRTASESFMGSGDHPAKSTFIDKGYPGFSSREVTARSFARGDDGNGTLYRLHLKKGQTAIKLGKFASWAEGEHLLPRGTTFKIIKRSYDNRADMSIVDVEVIETEKKSLADMVWRGVTEKHLPGKHDQSTHGQRGGASGIPDVRFRGGVDAASFISARNMSERSPYISQSSVDDLKGVSLFLSSDDKVGYGVTKDGDLVNVFNNGGEKGSGSAAVLQAISEHKAKTLDCFDGKLPQIYSRAGLVPVGRMKFDENYAPAGWDYAANDHPDVVFMAYQGGSRKGLGKRYGKFEKYDAAAGRYFTDYDQAKSASLAAAQG